MVGGWLRKRSTQFEKRFSNSDRRSTVGPVHSLIDTYNRQHFGNYNGREKMISSQNSITEEPSLE